MEKALKLPDELPQDFRYTDEGGLTGQEADELRARGYGNRLTDDGGKSIGQILVGNLFTLFNLLNLLLAVCLLLVGSYRNTLFMIVVIANTLIGTVQEFRAMKVIREMKLLNTGKISVLRDGREIPCAPDETVRGDLVVLRAGDQVPADAVVVRGGGAAVEALLTGESDPVEKRVNSWLYSGSYVSEGKMTAQLVYVAEESYVGKLTREAKKTARPGSRLMQDLRKLIRADSMVLLPLGLLLFLKQYFLNHQPVGRAVPSSVAAMLGMIPEGLILLTSVAMAVGVIRLGKRKTLVQELAGIETLARADILCLDKTGTITTGEMTLDGIVPVDVSEAEIREALGRFLGVFDEQSGTLDALRKSVAPQPEKAKAVVPFSSERKQSAVTFLDGTALVLGAPEFVLGPQMTEKVRETVGTLTAEGKRVLVLAGGTGIVSADNMPPLRKVYGLCALSDTLRPGARETLEYFRQQEVAIRVISGDNPKTVSEVARKAGLEGWDRWVDAATLTDDRQLKEAAETCTVFGRVTPEQKKKLVLALKAAGHNVAMTGDGVNDIPALKAADCSIAMAGGSDAARNAAQLTLLESDFTVMPQIVLEGRRVINNITRSASLFLMKTVFSFLLSVLTLLIPKGAYPFQPIQMTLVSSLMIGLPGFVLALEPSGERIRGSFLKTVLFRALPGGAAVAMTAAAAMALHHFGWDAEECGTISTILAGIMGYAVLVQTCIPVTRLRIALLAVVAAGFALGTLCLKKVFFLVPLTGPGWTALAILTAAGLAVITAVSLVLRKQRRSKCAET